MCVSKHKHIPGSSVVENTLAKQMTQVLSLGWEIPGIEEPGGVQSKGSPEADTT